MLFARLLNDNLFCRVLQPGLGRASATLGSILACGLFVAGCATPRVGAHMQARYDFGPPPALATSAALPARSLAVADVTAPSWLDGNGMIYRLAYQDERQPRAYADSHWTAPPAALLTQRLKALLITRVNVAPDTGLAGTPTLRLELEEFSQIFDSSNQSHVLVRLRASLLQRGTLLAQHTFVATLPCNSPNADGGAHALALVADTTLADIAQWAVSAPVK